MVRPKGAEATQATLQQLAAEAPDLTLAVSRLSVLECRLAPLRRGDQASLDCFEALFSSLICWLCNQRLCRLAGHATARRLWVAHAR